MARGRMINNKITTDKKINNLSSDTSRLAFTWLVTFADINGNVTGDPHLIRSMLFPRRNDVSTEMIEGFIIEWAEAELVTWYEIKDDLYINFTAFDKNQIGLRKDRENADIPKMTADCRIVAGLMPDTCRNDAGKLPETIPPKLKESKLIKTKVEKEEENNINNVSVVLSNIFRTYEQNIGPLTPVIADLLGGAVDDYTEPWVTDAIAEAVKRGIRNWSYVNGILQNWRAHGRDDPKKNGRKADKVIEAGNDGGWGFQERIEE